MQYEDGPTVLPGALLGGFGGVLGADGDVLLSLSSLPGSNGVGYGLAGPLYAVVSPWRWGWLLAAAVPGSVQMGLKDAYIGR